MLGVTRSAPLPRPLDPKRQLRGSLTRRQGLFLTRGDSSAACTSAATYRNGRPPGENSLGDAEGALYPQPNSKSLPWWRKNVSRRRSTSNTFSASAHFRKRRGGDSTTIRRMPDNCSRHTVQNRGHHYAWTRWQLPVLRPRRHGAILRLRWGCFCVRAAALHPLALHMILGFLIIARPIAAGGRRPFCSPRHSTPPIPLMEGRRHDTRPHRCAR